MVSNGEDDWGSAECWDRQSICNDDDCTSLVFLVREQGTFRFPYNTVGEAMQRLDPVRNAGWTVLIKPGNYPEALTISTPVTLKADGGTVTIGVGP
jgi:hypothetical protein